MASGAVSGGKGLPRALTVFSLKTPCPKLRLVYSSEEGGPEITQGPPQGARRQQGSGKGPSYHLSLKFPLPVGGGQG